MSEHRRTQDGVAASTKGPIDRIGQVLNPEDGVIEIPGIRQSDLEPYVGLRYLSKLFKLMGVILGLLLLAEVVTGVMTQGGAAVPTLLGEASRLIVLAGLLWGVGDLAILLIDVGHDVRAARILLARQTLGAARTVGRDADSRGASGIHRAGASVITDESGTIVALQRDLTGSFTLSNRGIAMLFTIAIVLLVLWALGFAFKVGGGLIHALLVIALIVVVYRLVTGQKVV